MNTTKQKNINSCWKLLWPAIIILAYTSSNQWSKLPIFNTQIERIIQFFVLVLMITIITLKGVWKSEKTVFLFVLWALVGIVRGILVADCYWEYNQLTIGTMCLSLPLLVYLFDEPKRSRQFHRYWLLWCCLPFFFFMFWTVGPSQFFLAPLFFIGCFLFKIPKRWAIYIGILLALMLAHIITERAQGMKVVATIGLALMYFLHKIVPTWFVKVLHWAFYATAIVLLVLGITGVFNVFSDNMSQNTGKYETYDYTTGESEDFATDTRTFIYQEVIQSALVHDYVIAGRTPALGNDDYWFLHNNPDYNKNIRYFNEVCHPNIFTWLGLIGLILYSLIYLRASYLAVYKSRSFALKVVGLFIAFHWMMGWIEDINLFNISNISLWIAIAMGFSKKFREMDDASFVIWLKSIFHRENRYKISHS